MAPHDAFMKKARECNPECHRCMNPDDADVIVIGHVFDLPEVWKETAFFVILDGHPIGHHPENVVFVRTEDQIKRFLQFTESLLQEHIYS